MLPTVAHSGHTPQPSALGPAFGFTVRYTTRSNDVIDGQLRVSVSDEASGRVIWHTERVLAEHEIVEYVKDSISNSLRWTIHRPKSGWYIRLRSPLFPPRSYVPLIPCEVHEGEPSLGILAFSCQTRIDMTPPPPAYPSSSTDNLGSREPSASTDYSYPPVSPLGSPPISSSVGGILDSTRPIRSSIDSTSSSTASSSTMPPIRQTVHSPPPAFGAPPTLTTASSHARSEVTRFLMTPRPIAQASGRAARSRLSFLPLAVTESLLGRGKSFAIQTADVTSPNGLPPVLIFHDTTPILGARSTSGTIELDHGVARALGVEPSWWIAVALAYVEFLDERDGYLAAADG